MAPMVEQIDHPHKRLRRTRSSLAAVRGWMVATENLYAACGVHVVADSAKQVTELCDIH